jgi:hypothetical protein
LEWEWDETGGGGGGGDGDTGVTVPTPRIEVYDSAGDFLADGTMYPSQSLPVTVAVDTTKTLYVRIIGSEGDYTITYY